MALTISPGRTFRSVRPQGSFALNASSGQAQGLMLWATTTGPFLQDLAQFAPSTYSSGFPRSIGSLVGGLATDFSVVGGHFDIQNFQGPSLLTVSAWVRAPAGAPSWSAILECNRGGLGDFGLWKSGNGAFYHFRWGTGAAASDFGTFTASEYVHLAGTFDGTNARAYQNGLLTFGPTASSRTPITDLLTIGGNTGGEGWGGTISDVRVYNRALTDTEVWGLYDPVTRWDLYWQPAKRLYIDVPPGPGYLLVKN
jgi:hypothetical protein